MKTIKLITLNAWGGRRLWRLLDFFAAKAGEIDIFCLQEMFDADQYVLDERHPDMKLCGDLFNRVSEKLPDHRGSFAHFDHDPDHMSLAMFVRKTVDVRSIADFIVHRPGQPKETGSIVLSSRKLQHATFDLNGRECMVANFHGLWVHGPKTDTPERLAQGRNVRAFLDGVKGPKVLCGDFNLLPDNESLRVMSEGMRNLVTETGVASTRTPLYRHYDDPAEPNFADYVLTSPELTVHHFDVLPDQVSDHAPLFLEFS